MVQQLQTGSKWLITNKEKSVVNFNSHVHCFKLISPSTSGHLKIQSDSYSTNL